MINKDKKEIQFEQPSDILLFANRYIMFIIGFIILSILASGYFFVLKPKIDDTNSVELANTETEARKQDNELLLKRLGELESEYQDIINNRKEDLALLKKIVPQGPQSPEIFLMADRLAKLHDFQLTTINISEKLNAEKEATPEATEIKDETVNDVLAGAGIKSILMKLSVSKTITNEKISGGDIYNNFKSYLAELEDSIRLLDIQAINFMSVDEETEEGTTYTFNLDLVTYYQ